MKNVKLPLIILVLIALAFSVQSCTDTDSSDYIEVTNHIQNDAYTQSGNDTGEETTENVP